MNPRDDAASGLLRLCQGVGKELSRLASLPNQLKMKSPGGFDKYRVGIIDHCRSQDLEDLQIDQPNLICITSPAALS